MADFGVARFQNNGGVMTAETGTYRWMAPEVRLSSFLNPSITWFRRIIQLYILVVDGAHLSLDSQI